MVDDASLVVEKESPKTAQSKIDYQRMRTVEWQKYVTSYTPEQIRLQKQAHEIDKLWQQEKDPRGMSAKALRKRHEKVVNRLIALTYPEGHTERYRHSKEDDWTSCLRTSQG